ncbi:MAG: hypothetical protein R2784_17445 [Saprospiraceae bacterium]
MKINLVLQKTLLLLIMLNFVSYSGICQQPFCGTKADPYNSIFALPPNLTNKPGPTGPYFIKLNLYNIKKDDGSGGVSLDTINMALDLMEQDFSPHNIFFVRDCAINDIFVSEFQYTQDHYLHNSVWDNPDCSQNDGINIFFAPFDLQPGPGNAFTPPVLPTNKVWIGSREGNIPTILTKTFSHEIGHCLGLFHTFYNMTLSDKAGIPCCESEEPLYQQGTRDTCGDYVSDTHADPRYWYSYFEFDSVGNKIIDCDSILFNCSGMASQNIGCFADPNSFCPPGRDFFGIIFSPPYANIMSYQVENACREGFTTGQGERMRLIIDSSSLLQQVLVDTALFSCCGTDSSIVLNNTTYSECITRGQFPSPPGTVYVVNGTFEIDQDATFNDYQFVFSSCGQSPGEIKINSNIKATFKSCDLYGCKTMWKGITAGTSSKLYLINSNISDAYYAIEGLPQSNIFINGTNSFLDNYIGIKGYSISNLLVNGVTFDFQEFKPNYFGMPSIGIKTWAGIEISKSSIIEGRRTTGLVSNSCNFFNLYNGIITEDSDVHITYPRFENILGTTPGFSFPLDGYGIKSIGTGNTFYLRGYGKYSSTKTFNLVTVGVSLSGMALDQILDCKMENLEVGIHCSNTVPAGTLSAIVSIILRVPITVYY